MRGSVSGNIVDVQDSRIYPGTLMVSEGRIADIIPEDRDYDTYILPGFVDAHIHIESSMLTPSQFARAAVVHGTVAVVSDPHEIANVLGLAGVRYMLEDAARVPLKFCFGAPSCVPASPFETSGATLGPEGVEELLAMEDIGFLGEVMNFPGVIKGDPGLMAKIEAAKRLGKPVDGHAPGLKGKDLERYAAAGIATDHECLSKEEALEKIKQGMKVLIREGSAAKDFEELAPLLGEHPESCMFCTDDLHPDDLMRGHINLLVKRALDQGIDLMKVLQAACVNPVLHYGLEVGLLREGDPADFLVVDGLDTLNVLMTYINGEVVAEKGVSLIEAGRPKAVNNFRAKKIVPRDLALPARGRRIKVMEAVDGQLLTERAVVPPKVEDGYAVADPERDILKIAVVNRYREAEPAVAFVRNFGLTTGAIASSVAHDSHNIIAVGTSDEDMARAVNLVIEDRGGISAVSGDREEVLPLPVAGLMSTGDCPTVAERYTRLDRMAKSMGSRLKSPFMTLSFMALLVIPKLKLGDRGLFDGERFEFVDVFEV